MWLYHGLGIHFTIVLGCQIIFGFHSNHLETKLRSQSPVKIGADFIETINKKFFTEKTRKKPPFFIWCFKSTQHKDYLYRIIWILSCQYFLYASLKKLCFLIFMPLFGLFWAIISQTGHIYQIFYENCVF